MLLVFFRTDIVLYLCEKEHVEGGMIFQLLEDLTEMSTMRNCKDIFGYIESKQDILGKVSIIILVVVLSFFLYSCISILHSNIYCSCSLICNLFYTAFLSLLLMCYIARALCQREACYAENMQSATSSSIKGWECSFFLSMIIHISS